jgi:hypothetical protein
MVPDHADIKELSWGTSLMGFWQENDRIYVVDALSSGAFPGNCNCLELREKTLNPVRNCPLKLTRR